MKNRIMKALFAAVVICALVPRTDAHAQGPVARAMTAWSTATNYLGIDNFSCDCTLSFGSPNVPRRFVFRSEPIVLGVAADGASYGILRRGDYITHVGGYSILTTEGARRFAGKRMLPLVSPASGVGGCGAKLHLTG